MSLWDLIRPGSASLALALLGSFASAADNLLVIVADDLGVDVLAAYDEGGACSGNGQQCFSEAECPGPQTCVRDYPSTPTIDRLTAEGVLFRNAWSAPLCTPTRAAVQTGRYGLRTGVMTVGAGNALPLGEWTLPEILDADPAGPGYTHAAIGKWHLGGGNLGPNDHGYSHYSGFLVEAGDYFTWDRTVDGVTETCSPGSAACPVTSYVTSVNVDDALDWIDAQAGPWFVWLAFFAPHSPFHVPPHELVSAATLDRLPTVDGGAPAPPGTECTGAFRRPCYLAAIEAMDAEIDRLLAAVPANTTVIFLGDNGTPSGVTTEPSDPDHAKGTVYEGGVNVPMIVRTAQLDSPGMESQALVHVVDIFATVLDIAEAEAPDDGLVRDGRSLVPLFADPTLALRGANYTEHIDVGAVRDGRFKLIERTTHEELYDLSTDPFEAVDLLEGVCSVTSTTVCHADSNCPDAETCELPALHSVAQVSLDELRETMVDLALAAGRVPDGGGAVPGSAMTVQRATGGSLTLAWDPSCDPGDNDYGVYEGQIGAWSSHEPVVCSTGGTTSVTLTPAGDDRYFLVVPQNGTREGSYGVRSDRWPRPASATACLRTSTGGCE